MLTCCSYVPVYGMNSSALQSRIKAYQLWLPSFQPAFLPASLYAFLHACLLDASLPACLPSFLPAYYLPAFLPSCGVRGVPICVRACVRHPSGNNPVPYRSRFVRDSFEIRSGCLPSCLQVVRYCTALHVDTGALIVGRGAFGIRSGFVRDSFGIRSRFVRDACLPACLPACM